MTTPVSDRLSQLYVGNGTNKRFDFTFRVFQQEDETGISIRKKGAVEFETLDPSTYVVQINQDDMGGYVTFNTAPESGTYFYIAGTTSLDQLLDITNYDNFYPDAIERALDKLTALLQERITEIDQEKQSRILADLKYDALAMEREDNLENRLTSYINAMLGVTNPAIFDGISDRMIITKDGRTQREFNETLPFWTDEFVKFMQETYLREEQIIDHVDEQIAVEKDRAQIAESNLNTKIDNEKTRALAAEALLSSSIGAVGQGYFKSYPTLAAANADIANIPLSVSVKVLSSIDGGDYYKATASATTLTKSPYDPVVDANNYTNTAIQNTGIVKKPYSQIDLKALATLQGFVGTNGAYNANTAFRCTDFIAVSEGQLIAIVAKGHGSVATLATYNSSQVLIQNYTSGTEPYNINVTVPAGVSFIRVSYTATSTVTQTGTLTQPLVYKDITERADFLDFKNNNDYVNSTIKYAAFDKVGQYTVNGTTFLTNTGFASFTPIAVNKGQQITAYMYGSTGGAAGLFFKNAAGVVTKTNFVGSTGAFETLTYTPAEDGTYWINTVIPTDPSTIYAKKYRVGYFLAPDSINVDVPSQKNFDDLATIVNSYWKGKKIVWVGTSIPATDTNGKSYPVLVGEQLGCTMHNKAIGESWISFNKANPSTAGNASYKTMSATKAEIRELAFNLWGETSESVLAKMEQCSYEYLLLGSDADLVVFDHMHNDIGRSYITYADSEINSMERTSFYGAYNYVIDKLYQDNPNVRIVFVTPPNRFLRASPGYTLEKFDAFCNCMRNLARKYNAPCIDLSVLSNTNQSNYQRWTRTADGANDDIHPGSAARVRYANILAQAIRAIG